MLFSLLSLLFIGCKKNPTPEFDFKRNVDNMHKGYAIINFSPEKLSKNKDIENLIIPKNHNGKPIIRIYEDVFKNNKDIKNLTIESEFFTFSILKECFNSSSIEKVYISEDIKNLDIHEYAFAESNLEYIQTENMNPIQIESGSNSLSIREGAFRNSKLKSIYLPKATQIINIKETFSGIENITIYVEDTKEDFEEKTFRFTQYKNLDDCSHMKFVYGATRDSYKEFLKTLN